jgi:hypothetical protein
MFTLTFSLLFLIAGYSQDSIHVSRQGISKGILETKLTDDIIYNRAIEWVNKTYQNPDKVLTGKVTNKSLNLSGYSENAWYYKSLGLAYFYNTTYGIYITIDKGHVEFVFDEKKHISSNTSAGPTYIDSRSWFKDDGEYRKAYNTAKETYERTINNLWFSFVNTITSTEISSDEALAQLKKAKDKLDLGLITQEEYDKIKAELTPFIK